MYGLGFIDQVKVIFRLRVSVIVHSHSKNVQFRIQELPLCVKSSSNVHRKTRKTKRKISRRQFDEAWSKIIRYGITIVHVQDTVWSFLLFGFRLPFMVQVKVSFRCKVSVRVGVRITFTFESCVRSTVTFVFRSWVKFLFKFIVRVWFKFS